MSPIFAAQVSSPTAMDSMLKVMNQVVTFAMGLFTTITGNPILSFIFAGSLVGIGITVFNQLKGAAR